MMMMFLTTFHKITLNIFILIAGEITSTAHKAEETAHSIHKSFMKEAILMTDISFLPINIS
jgi:hypothetical protein